jgi:acyl carrier protein
MDEIRDKLVNKAAELCGANAKEIRDETDFSKDLGMKSATMVVLIAYLEDELDVDIDFMLFSKAGTLGGIVEYLDHLCNN